MAFEKEMCEKCGGKFPVNQTFGHEGKWYCSPCHRYLFNNPEYLIRNCKFVDEPYRPLQWWQR